MERRRVAFGLPDGPLLYATRAHESRTFSSSPAPTGSQPQSGAVSVASTARALPSAYAQPAIVSLCICPCLCLPVYLSLSLSLSLSVSICGAQLRRGCRASGVRAAVGVPLERVRWHHAGGAATRQRLADGAAGHHPHLHPQTAVSRAHESTHVALAKPRADPIARRQAKCMGSFTTVSRPKLVGSGIHFDHFAGTELALTNLVSARQLAVGRPRGRPCGRP
jgi:hypothetical protein